MSAKHFKLAADGNSLVRQHEVADFTNLTVLQSVSGSEPNTQLLTSTQSTFGGYNFTPDPYLNLTAAQQNYCADVELFNQVRVYLDVFVVGPMCLAGIVGNLLAILALRLEHSSRTVTFLLQALAVADNAYLISSLLIQTLKSATECTELLAQFRQQFPFWEIFLWPLSSIAQTTTVWLTVLVTVDRYVAICRPFESMRHHVSNRAKRAVYFIIFIAILYNIPRFFEKEVLYLPDHCNRKFQWFARHTRMLRNRYYKLVYKTIMFLLFRMFGPLMILMVLNVKLIQTLRRARKDHAQLTQTANQRTNNYFNLVLVAVVTVFIICQMPDLILRVLVTIKTYTSLNFNTYWPVLFTNMMLTVNSSVNCLIYCLTGRKFRQILYRILCRPVCRKRTITDETSRYGNSEAVSGTTNHRRIASLSNSNVNETCL